MKKLFSLAFFVALFCAGSVRADDIDAARAAVRGSSSTSSVVSSRTESRDQRTQSSTKSNQQSSTRGTVPRASSETKTRSAVPQTKQTREVSLRAAVLSPAVTTRSAVSNVSEVGRSVKNSTRNVGTNVSARSTMVARAGVTAARITGTPAAGYKVCRDTFFQCMDEFCANKDAQLKRCACSSRIHDFDKTKQTLNTVENKMLDFNERLLAVNMDKEDATAMSTATEGEKAYQKEDKSDSQSILNNIMKKLQSSNEKITSSNSLAAINLSMDTNVFDTIDSQMGAETTTKEGDSLYKAALPTCLEMANEVCAEDETPIAQNAYVAAIEQDCNIVSKTYDSLKDKTLEKVREGNALLEMSRLNNQQTRNSDDILACKKKMLDALTDSSVCGEDMGKCLDWSGKYINPATGSAILTSDLSQLKDMIRRPSGTEKWIKTGTNKKFVTFLETKKKYIEPAMKNCESLESTVWNDFLEDALAKIKLAQEKKLEDMRQSCTTITTQCLTNTSNSLIDFDSRALSIFGVNYDKNVNQICLDIKNACTTLINGHGTDSYWGEAIGDIATAKTLDQIITTCTEVGKNCIIRNCMNLESKFGLCQSETSIMRTNILKHDENNPCWDEVKDCVADSGVSVISDIMTSTGRFGTDNGLGTIIEKYNGGDTMYERTSLSTSLGVPLPAGIYLWCSDDTNNISDLCRITERVWGNCNESPFTGEGLILNTNLQSNSILAWFAENTNSSCNATTCNPGEIFSELVGCFPPESFASDKSYCPTTVTPMLRFDIVGDTLVNFVPPNGGSSTTEWSNCCASNKKDGFGNCCIETTSVLISFGFESLPPDISNICSYSTSPSEFITISSISVPGYPDPNALVCVGGSVDWGGIGSTATCSGRLMILNKRTGLYLTPSGGTETAPQAQAYYNIVGGQCIFTNDGGSVSWTSTLSGGTCDKITGMPSNVVGSDNNLFIDYL